MTPRNRPPSPDGSVPAWQPRFAAGVTAALLLLHLAGVSAWLLVPLLADLAARALDRRDLSWLARLGALTLPRWLPQEARDARARWAPKRFTARLGLVLLGVILGAAAAGAPGLATPLAAAMATLCALEAGLGVCAACHLYTLGGRLGWVTACPDGRCTLAPGTGPGARPS